MVKNEPASAGDVSSIPGPGRSHISQQLILRSTATESIVEPSSENLQFPFTKD